MNTVAPMWRNVGRASHAPIPETAMAFAFIKAARESGARREMVIPTGAVDAQELKRVVIALACARESKA